ncbi:MAG: DEDD exonuclease domain-containing protein [Ignavibacteria bacterium]
MPKTEIIESCSIRDTAFVVIDVETTGLSHIRDRMTEIALLKVVNGEIVSEFTSLINPEQFIPPYITELTGITNDMVYDKPKFSELMPEVRKFIFGDQGDIILGGHNVSFDYNFLNSSFLRSSGDRLNTRTLCTCRLARRLNQSLRSKSLASLSRYHGIHIRRQHRAMDDAKATAQIMIDYIDKLVNEYGVETLDELLSFQYKKIYEPSKIPANIKRIKNILRDIPHKSGVYFMKNKNDKLLYVGKAKNLHSRLNSYFYHNISHTSKIKKLIRQVHTVEYEETASELSALILESRLIKKHKPDFNSAIRRYRRFPFIKIDVQHEYPKISKTYEVALDGAKYYGPFKSSFTVEMLIERINRTYKLRKCRDIKLKPTTDFSPCMYYQIKQCDAPCNFTQSEPEYKHEVHRVRKFLEAETGVDTVKSLETQMYKLSDEMNYEDASLLRDRILDLKKVILNMELTSSEVNLKNFIVKCRDGCPDKTHEVFFVANGRLFKNLFLDLSDGQCNYEEDYLIDLIDSIYFSGSLFGSVMYSDNGKFSREELDRMKIISNWIYLNNSSSTFMKVGENTKIENILSFIYK